MQRHGSGPGTRSLARAEADDFDPPSEQARLSAMALLVGSVALLNVASAIVTLLTL